MLKKSYTAMPTYIRWDEVTIIITCMYTIHIHTYQYHFHRPKVSWVLAGSSVEAILTAFEHPEIWANSSVHSIPPGYRSTLYIYVYIHKYVITDVTLVRMEFVEMPLAYGQEKWTCVHAYVYIYICVHEQYNDQPFPCDAKSGLLSIIPLQNLFIPSASNLAPSVCIHIERVT